MDEDERYAKGMAVRRKVLGNAWVDRAEAGKTALQRRIPGDDHTARPGVKSGPGRISTSGPGASSSSAP